MDPTLVRENTVCMFVCVFVSKYLEKPYIINFDMFKNKCNVYKTLLNSAKTAFYREKFGNCDTKKLFQLVKNLSVVDKGCLLPDCNSNKI